MAEACKDPWWSYLVVGALIAPIIAGPVLAYWFDNSSWLALCGFIILFLS
jgi:hypothetical protein